MLPSLGETILPWLLQDIMNSRLHRGLVKFPDPRDCMGNFALTGVQIGAKILISPLRILLSGSILPFLMNFKSLEETDKIIVHIIRSNSYSMGVHNLYVPQQCEGILMIGAQ